MRFRGMAGDAPLSALLERASTYVEHFQQTFSAVVMEERYVQVVKVWSGKPPEPGTEPELAWKSSTKEPSGARGDGLVRRRQLLSDVLLVQAVGQGWMGYRDVAEVDGRSVRDRNVRVQTLFMSGRADDRRQLQRIAQESARFNLGVGRNLNLPTFPLQALAASALGRFGWTPYPDEPLDASCCAVVGLREVSSPTMVRTGDDHDLPMTGRAWIEPGTGRVRRASLQFGGPLDQVEGAFEVTYGAMDGIDVLIPTRLWEWYRRRDQDYLGLPAYVEGQATYSDIRRFTVRTDEMIN